MNCPDITRIFRRYALAFFAICAAVPILSGCAAGGAARNRDTLLALDTVIDLTVYGERFDKGMDAAKDTIARYESLLSVTDESSDIYCINSASGGTVKVDERTAELIHRAKELSGLVGGSFDISIYPVVRAWGFTTDEYRIPPRDEIDKLLKNVGYERIVADAEGNTVAVPDGMMLDLGGVAKGYIGDRVIDALRGYGVTSAIINLGGNVQTLGDKPGGKQWSISIRDPGSPAQTFCTVSLGEGAVITSGGYQRYFTGSDGAVYHHLFNPATGYPANSGLLSATVVTRGGECGFYGDGLSTAVFVMGKDAALDFWRELNGTIGDTRIDLILVTDEGEVVITPGIEESFKLTSDNYRLSVAHADDS